MVLLVDLDQVVVVLEKQALLLSIMDLEVRVEMVLQLLYGLQVLLITLGAVVVESLIRDHYLLVVVVKAAVVMVVDMVVVRLEPPILEVEVEEQVFKVHILTLLVVVMVVLVDLVLLLLDIGHPHRRG